MNSCEDGTSKQMHTEVPSPTSVIVSQKLTSQVQKVMFFLFFHFATSYSYSYLKLSFEDVLLNFLAPFLQFM